MKYHTFEFVQRKRVVPKDARGTQSFNEVWLEVQERFIQDHQDFGRATGEAFKLVWIKKP